MFKNYFVLNRHAAEVNKLLSNFSLENVFTQEKNKLVFYLRSNLEEYIIELNADHLLPYFIIRKNYKRAKKNTLDFFEAYLPSKLFSVKIAEFDRVIQFNLKDASIYFYIHGKDTNVFLIDKEKKFDSFKKIENEQKLVDEIDKMHFTNLIQTPEIILESNETPHVSISKSYPYLGNEIIDELNRRSKTNSFDKKEIILHKILKEVETTRPFVYKDKLTDKFRLSFFDRGELQSKELTIFDNINEALNSFIVQEHKHKLGNSLSRQIENKFDKKIIKLEKNRDRLQERINAGCKEQKYQQIAKLLMMNIDNIERGVSKVELENSHGSNKIISIDLSPRLNLRENINYYFDKAKSERKEFEKLSVLLSNINGEIKKLKATYEETKNNQPSMNQSLSSKEPIQNKNSKHFLQEVKSKFRQFILYDKYLIFVGKNSKNNDELTTSFAKQNDYWFHARSVSGSHVVLRYDKSHKEIQKIVLEKTASVAAFYSKAKSSGLVPVSYTQKKYVIKRKGMEPGKVQLLKEKVLIVKPEIPKECKLITDE